MASDEKKEETGPGRENYIDVQPFVVTMYHRGRPRGSMAIVASIKLEDEEKRIMAQKILPRLSSGYVIEASRLAHDYFDVDRPVSVAVLGNALQGVTNRILGHSQAHLLISNVTVQRKSR